MTLEDFIAALIPIDKSLLPDRSEKLPLPAAFKIADQNKDGLISYEEYPLFFLSFPYAGSLSLGKVTFVRLSISAKSKPVAANTPVSRKEHDVKVVM